MTLQRLLCGILISMLSFVGGFCASVATLAPEPPAAPVVYCLPPIESNVRIAVEDAEGNLGFGSGTVIDAGSELSVVLTCGHVLWNAKSVELLFQDGRTVVGQIGPWDLDAEVGLVFFECDNPPRAVRLAANSAAVGDRLASIGCSGGRPATIDVVTVTRRNRYGGPENLECTVAPEKGRSGGGLFNAAGELVGVCFAIDVDGDRGLYAGLEPVREMLWSALP